MMSGERERILGVDIGGTKCAVCLGDPDGNILGRRVIPTDEPAGPEPTLKRLLALAEELLNEHDGELTSIGISCGSPQDNRRGLILAPPNLPSWVDVPITTLFSNHFSRPAYLENDADAGALAEHRFGAGRGCRHLAFMTFGTGFGAGLILNGQLYRGANSRAGELGHFRLAPDGPMGYHKAGSFEGFCSGGGLPQIFKLERERGGHSRLGPDPTARDLAEAARDGDELARRVFEISGDHLGRGLAYVIDLLNLERILIGSIYARCEDLLRPAMLRRLEAECLPGSLADCDIRPAELGERIGDLAALSIARYHQSSPN